MFSLNISHVFSETYHPQGYLDKNSGILLLIHSSQLEKEPLVRVLFLGEGNQLIQTLAICTCLAIHLKGWLSSNRHNKSIWESEVIFFWYVKEKPSSFWTIHGVRSATLEILTPQLCPVTEMIKRQCVPPAGARIYLSWEKLWSYEKDSGLFFLINRSLLLESRLQHIDASLVYIYEHSAT